MAVLRVSMGQSTVLQAGQVHDVPPPSRSQTHAAPTFAESRRPDGRVARQSVARLPNVSQLGSLAWLQNAADVTFPDEAEIMQVSVTCDDQRTAETLADTIVEVYLQDIVYAEHQEKLNRINTLQKAETETEANLRKKRSGLRQLVDTLGTGDSEALTLAQNEHTAGILIFGPSSTRSNSI